MIPLEVTEAISGTTGEIRTARPVGGGCIAYATRLETNNGLFFLKWAEEEAGRTFGAEAEGLQTLRKQVDGLDLIVPEPISWSKEDSDVGFLLMEWLEAGHPEKADWRRFGAALAEFHQREAIAGSEGDYGFEIDNWIGSKPQRNAWMESWPAFFGEKRLRAQAETVRQRGYWNAAWDAPLERLIDRLPEFLPENPLPSLLHGDLWAGNALPTTGGLFAIIDPAVYVGHREADLAMTELFGGFAPGFYEGYNEAWKLDSGYPKRREIYNLFHLINHLTHGPGYAGQVERVLNRYAS